MKLSNFGFKLSYPRRAEPITDAAKSFRSSIIIGTDLQSIADYYFKTGKKKAYALGGAQFKKFARPGGIPSSFFIIAYFGKGVNTFLRRVNAENPIDNQTFM